MARRRTHSSPSPRRRYFHRRPATTYGLVEASGGAISALSVVTASVDNGAPVWYNLAQGAVGPATYDISQTINPFGNDDRYGGQRAAFWTGIGLFVAGRIARRVVPGLHRASLKVGRHTKVALW